MLTIEGQIVNIDSTTRGRIEIGGDGLIVKVGEPTGQADIVLADELIFPGFVDVHVHAREDVSHQQDYKEDFFTAGQAAINGGVVAFCDMPNNPVPPVDEQGFTEKHRLSEKCVVEVVLYAGMGPTTKPLAVGAGLGRPFDKTVPYKIFTSQSIGEIFFHDEKGLESAISKHNGQSISFHCEDPEVLSANKNQPTHEQRRPAEAEIKAVEFALQLIEKYQLQGKICHVSTTGALEKIAAAKKRGLSVTAEVTPHHLYFDETMITDENRKMLQVNPPIRSQKDRVALIQGLRDGTIDYLATDHAPHTIAEKEKGISGMPHLDTYGTFVVWLMKEHQFTPQDIARVCSFNPGQFINQFTSIKYGQIKPGFAGSLTILDLNRPIIINKSILKTKCAWSPFEGMTFPGRVACTIVKGKVYKM